MVRLLLAIILYVVIIATIIYTKPAIMFDSNNEVKKWGIDRDENTSIFSPMITFPVIAIICYYVATVIEFM
jgi:hypothetical protein